jgi:hypothetical protein
MSRMPNLRTSIRPVRCTVTGNVVGQALVDSYDKDAPLGKKKSGRIYKVPLYLMRLAGHDDSGKIQYYDFKVIRFGVGHSGNGPDFIAGKSRQGVHTLKWGGKYMSGKGCWRLSGYKQVLIHDGADFAMRQAYGAIGCIEVTGRKAWEKFNQRVRDLSGNSNLKKIGLEGKFKCELLQTSPPPLRRVS